MYDYEFLKNKGFFKNFYKDNIEIEGKQISYLVDSNNALIYFEINIDDLNNLASKIARAVTSLYQKIDFVWFKALEKNKIKIYSRNTEIKWFNYDEDKRSEIRKSKELLLNKISPSKIKGLFDLKGLENKFYNELWDVRLKIAKSINLPLDDASKLLVAQRFIDRTIFLYFLSGLNVIWITKDGTTKVFNTKHLRDTLKWLNDNCKEDIFQFLNSIFFDILNVNKNDKFTKKTFEECGIKFEIKGPYLDGGLFREEQFGSYSERNIKLKGVEDLIKLLNQYNWIVTENESDDTSNEETIGNLTPEILGHIYERFSVSFDSLGIKNLKEIKLDKLKESLKSGRKKIGSYYTPRPITNYMAKKAISLVLKNKIKMEGAPEVINAIVSDDNPIDKDKIDLKLVKEIYRKAKELTICDNACGSGSFLLAAGLEILNIFNKTYEYLKDEIKEDEDLFKEFEELKNKNRNYLWVKQIITKNLYGVDIMSGAIEVAKLRMWLWLVSQLKENEEFEILPNLDFNLLVGNSLIGFSKNIEEIPQLFMDQDEKHKLKDIISKRNKFKTLSQEEALKIKPQIYKELNEARKKLNEILIDSFQTRGSYISEEEILSRQPFHWNLEFDVFDFEKPKEERGFDIVMSNPPYIRGDKLGDEKRYLERMGYKVYGESADLYAYFYERSHQILKQNGVLAYITSNKWLRAKYGEKLREFLSKNTRVNQIIDFRGFPVFKGEATVDTCVLFFEKAAPSENDYAEIVNVDKNNFDPDKILQYIDTNKFSKMQSSLGKDIWVLENDEISKLKEKIEKIGKPLKNWDVQIRFGIKTGFNDAFIINTETKNRILANCKTDKERKRTEEIIKPILRGRDIEKWRYKWAGLWVIKIEAGWTNKNRGSQKPEEFFKNTFPSLYNYFMTFKDYKKGRGKGLFNRDDQGDYWWEL
ncbi:MAG: Eco57I restriction-modification methylase domain-containing protein, partial [Minisyncoccia bacterium]